MAGNKHTFSIRSIKGKIIIASVLACITLLLAWGISRVTFKQMLNAIAKISAPNDKLRLVNDLTHQVARLDQVQKSDMLNNPDNYYSFFRGTKKLLLTIDTLQMLFADDRSQTKRIRSLKKLLIDRDKLFINYLKVREGLVNNKAFSGQVKKLNELVNKIARQSDSALNITDKTTTTTIIPVTRQDSTKKSRGFFSKLFGKKKKPAQNLSYNKVVDEEFNVKHDTLAKAKQDSILMGMGETMHRLEKGQLRRSALFVNRETILNKANNNLIRRILNILKQVQADALTQIALNNTAAKTVVNSSISRINYIILVFFLTTIILLYFILTDITRSNKYRRELEFARDEAEYYGQAKHRFLSNMSHEIRTPLQSIIGYAELMKQQENLDKKGIEAIYQSSEHLMQIVNEVLDYNRIISGKFTFVSQVFGIIDLLNEVISVMRLQADKKEIKLIPDYNIPDTDYVEGDPFRLKQILYNILGNAIKFTDKGEVKLSISYIRTERELQYMFTVTDTGIGLSDKDITRIFNEFEQAQDIGHINLKGTGLGLTISKSLIEAQGGNISVKSKPGLGSSFTFRLNYKKAALQVAKYGKHADKPANAKRDKVWIIDDDNFILDLCSNMLENSKIKHHCFSSPAEVLNTAFDPAVKYILMDIRLPEMNGTELCKLLRKKIPADVQVFALTAQVLPNERELILSQGFDGLLTKPFRERDLLALVTQSTKNAEDIPLIKLDINKIERMTFGDKRQLNKTLKSFTEDCIDDIAELRLSLGTHDDEKTILLLHRIAGRIAQIGATELASDFRIAEIDFSKKDQADSEKTNTIIQLTDHLQVLLKQIRGIYLSSEIPESIT